MDERTYNKSGDIDGLYTKWEYNGSATLSTKIKEGTYKHGKKDGLWTWWDVQGNLIKHETYRDGMLI